MKLIIECAEQTYSECKKISGLSETAYVIAHGTPYNPSGDLISREALKKDIEKRCGEPFDYIKTIVPTLKAIDNAPTVETFTLEDMQNNFGAGVDSIIGKYDKAKGEWKTVKGIDGDEYYECPNCGEPWVLVAGTPKDNNMNFCPNCGADMRKGGAV